MSSCIVLISVTIRIFCFVSKSNYYNLEEARHLANTIDKETKFIKDNYLKNNELIVNKDIEELFNDTIVRAFKIKFKEELKYE